MYWKWKTRWLYWNSSKLPWPRLLEGWLISWFQDMQRLSFHFICMKYVCLIWIFSETKLRCIWRLLLFESIKKREIGKEDKAHSETHLPTHQWWLQMLVQHILLYMTSNITYIVMMLLYYIGMKMSVNIR